MLVFSFLLSLCVGASASLNDCCADALGGKQNRCPKFFKSPLLCFFTPHFHICFFFTVVCCLSCLARRYLIMRLSSVSWKPSIIFSTFLFAVHISQL